MTASIISIGNSRGIRIPKKVLDKYAMDGKVELVLSEEGIVVKPIQQPRLGWGDAFAKMAAAGDDELLLDDIFEDELLEW